MRDPAKQQQSPRGRRLYDRGLGPHPDRPPGWHCVIDFTMRAGNGYVRGHQARDMSGLSSKRACNAALSEAAAASLRDPRVQEYLAAR